MRTNPIQTFPGKTIQDNNFFTNLNMLFMLVFEKPLQELNKKN